MSLWLFRLGWSVLSEQLVLPGFQDGLDAFEAGGYGVREDFPAGALQPLSGIAVRQFQQGHTGLVTLLLHLVGGEEKPYHGSGVLADLLCPADKTLPVPLQVGLVIRRHMVLRRAILVGAAMETQVRGNPGSGKEDLHGSPGEPYIYLLLDILIWYGIIHALHADMVVVLDGSYLPDCQLKRRSRKRQQKQFLLCKTSC